MTFQWPDEAYAALSPETKAVRAVLQNWFEAMEDGTAAQRMPDPMGPADVTRDVADAIVNALDEEFERELRSWAYQESAGGYTAGPGFTRLEPPQRVALAQALHAILRANGRTAEPAPWYADGVPTVGMQWQSTEG